MSNHINELTQNPVMDSQADVRSLAELLAERFPEEAASADLSNAEGVFRLTMELLHRLWRWER
jgi:hypothetical protein